MALTRLGSLAATNLVLGGNVVLREMLIKITILLQAMQLLLWRHLKIIF